MGILSKDFPTVAFHASISNPFGKATPIPGETKVWQYVSLTKCIFMIDCPGVVPPSTCAFEEDCAKVFRGVVRVERVENPSNYIDEVLTRVKKEYLIKRYKLPTDTDWADGDGFLSVLAVKMGKLRKGGEPDIETCARIVLYDWQRGRIPFFTPPPKIEGDKEEEEEKAAQTETQSEHAKQVDTSQDMGELKCALEFDEADMAKPADQPESDAESDNKVSAAPKEAPKKKRKRARKGEDGEEEGQKKAKVDKVDWAAVHDEFGA